MVPDTQVYEPVSKAGTAMTKVIMDVWEKFGRPRNFETTPGRKLLRLMFDIWSTYFTEECADFIRTQYEKKKNEILLSEMTFGYTPLAYPPRLHTMIKAVFTDVRLTDKKTTRLILEILPELSSSNLQF